MKPKHSQEYNYDKEDEFKEEFGRAPVLSDIEEGMLYDEEENGDGSQSE